MSIFYFFWKLLAFLNLYHHAQNQFIPSVHFLDTVNFKGSTTRLATTIFAILTMKVLDQFSISSGHSLGVVSFRVPVHQNDYTHFWLYPPQKFSSFQFYKIVPACKKSFHLLILEIVNFRVQGPDWPHPYFPYAQLLIFENLYQIVKNEVASSIFFGKKLI